MSTNKSIWLKPWLKEPWIKRWLAVLTASVVVLNLVSRSEAAALYQESFDCGPNGWNSYVFGQRENAAVTFSDSGRNISLVPHPWVSRGANMGGYLESAGPWWTVQNFINNGGAQPGAGPLHVVSFLYLNRVLGGIAQPQLDLSNTSLSFRIKTEGLDLKGAHLVFWFQKYDAASGKCVNFALTRYPIEALSTPGTWSSVTLPLRPNSADWTCLGSSITRQNTYTCVPLADALQSVDVDLGFIILPVNPTDPPVGVIRLDDVSLVEVPTDPSGVGAARPGLAEAGDSTLLTVTVTPGQHPVSTGMVVTADLQAIGGSATQQFYDDGTHGDLTAGDQVFSFAAVVVANTTIGDKSLPVGITDAQTRRGAAAIPFSAISVGSTLYSASFDAGPEGWQQYLAGNQQNAVQSFVDSVGRTWSIAPSPWSIDGGNSHIVSTAPWWIDENHKPDAGQPPGAGYLHLVDLIWFGGYYGSTLPPYLDLRNTILRFRIKTEGLDLKGAHLVFWFQKYDAASGKCVNFALTRYPIEALSTPGTWSSVTLPLRPNSADWTCLGSSIWRQSNYTCVPVADALQHVDADMGFIILPLNADDAYNYRLNQLPSGVVRLDDVKIESLAE